MVRRISRNLVALTASAVLTIPLLTVPAEAAPAATSRQIDYRQWTTNKQLKKGSFTGTKAVRGSLRIDQPVGKRRYRDPHGHPTKRYEFGHWISPWTEPGFGLTELIASWDASTPRDTWVQVQVRGISEAGQRSSWDTLARWAEGDARFHRTTLGEQSDDLARVATDTWQSNYAVDFTSYQLKVSLYRRAGTTATPVVDTIGAMSSWLPTVAKTPTSRPGVARGITLNVPKYSQMIHEGDYPEYNAGGEAWCSPTSTSMVLGYYDRLPSSEEYAWVKTSHPNRFVDHAARMTFDYGYDGTGNWPFNTAYASDHVDHAFVTRLRSLREAEKFIKAGIPLVVSISFRTGELDGAPIGGTNGHLLVIVGFTESGDVVVNDPAGKRNRHVRRTYDRGQFENAWLPKSGGLTYVIRTSDQPLPARKGKHNW